MNSIQLKAAVSDGYFDAAFKRLYRGEAQEQKARYIKAVESFIALYGERQAAFYSVPGRSEISGNHTDHNHGCVLAAAIDLDIIAVASPSEKPEIRVKSEGFDEDIVDISTFDPSKAVKYSSSALIEGVAAGFEHAGYKAGGFVAYTTNNVCKGSGLSSSAAFEVMIGNILNHLYNGGKVEAPEIAKIAQYSENVFFGKPCGLMDQTACAVGGFVAIDFNDPSSPIIEKMPFDLTTAGYTLCITNTGGNHADLNDDYASVPMEMKAVAAELGQKVLRGLTAADVIERLPGLRGKVGDRAVLRALHFIAENERVKVQTEALRRGDVSAFLDGVKASGESSFMWLQNVYTTKNVAEQGLSLALAVALEALKGCPVKSAVRVHGGGFAGTVQAFVPTDFVPRFRTQMERVFGEGSCAALNVRGEGAIAIDEI